MLGVGGIASAVISARFSIAGRSYAMGALSLRESARD